MYGRNVLCFAVRDYVWCILQRYRGGGVGVDVGGDNVTVSIGGDARITGKRGGGGGGGHGLSAVGK